MKANCKALKFSILICSIFLILIVAFSILILKHQNKIFDILLNISIGVFGSGCVSLMLAIPGYNVSKRQLLEKYWQETQKIIKKFSNLKFLFNEYDEEILVKYVNELKNKKWKEEFNRISDDKIVIEEEKYKNKLIEEYIENHRYLKEKVSKLAMEQYASEQIDKDVKKIRKKAQKFYKEYIDISKQSTDELNLLLGDMEFITGKKAYLKIYQKTFQPIYEILDLILEKSYHFKLYIDGEGNETFALEELLSLQKEIFDIEIKETKETKSYIITNIFYNKMLVNLEEFRADMYNIRANVLDLHPTECRTYYKNKC